MAENSIWGGFESDEHLKRFLITIGVFFVLLTVSIAIVFSLLGLSVKSGDLEITVAGESRYSQRLSKLSVNNTGIALELDDGQKIGSLLLPANQVWLDSKIDVPAGATVHISASGSATLSVKRSIDIAQQPAKFDPSVYNNLTGPDGGSLNRNLTVPRSADEIRRPLLISPNAPPGALLATVQDEGFDFGTTPKPPSISAYELRKDGPDGIVIHAKSAGRLYLTVNDLIGSPNPADKDYWTLSRNKFGNKISESAILDNFKLSYGESANIPQRRQELSDRWDDMVKKSYFDIFVEDNAGYYMVAVSVQE